MNNLMLIPLAIMFILTIICMTYTGNEFEGVSSDYTETGVINFTEDETTKEGSAEFDTGEPVEYNIFDTTGTLIILIAAVAIGIVAGVTILGSGVTEMSQGLVFNSMLFLTLWTCLTVVASAFVFENIYTTMVWVGLTTAYALGLGSHMSDGD